MLIRELLNTFTAVKESDDLDADAYIERKHPEHLDKFKEFKAAQLKMMRRYKAFYKGKTTEVEAETSYAAQQKAATFFKAKKSYEVTVVLLDVPLDTASL